MQLDNAAFDRARNDVREAAATLRTDRSDADQRMAGVLGSSWVGAAADAMAEAWQDWLAAATDVEEGLAAMAQLLDAVQADWNRQDDESQRSLDQISAKIVDRLG